MEQPDLHQGKMKSAVLSVLDRLIVLYEESATGTGGCCWGDACTRDSQVEMATAERVEGDAEGLERGRRRQMSRS